MQIQRLPGAARRVEEELRLHESYALVLAGLELNTLSGHTL
jgi:hypothetical protein